MLKLDLLYAYWGKADKDFNYHLLPYHSLDVTAVAKAYLETHPELLNWFAIKLDLTATATLQFITFFIALHDLGKFSQTFQHQVPEVMQKINPTAISSSKNYDIRHDNLGLLFWRKKGFALFSAAWSLDDNQAETVKYAFDCWIIAVTGHHGQPTYIKNRIDFIQYFSKDDAQAADQWLLWVSQFFLAENPGLVKNFPDSFTANSQEISWWLSGLTILADWLGSDKAIFCYQSATNSSLAEYWDKTYKIAQQAIREKGLTQAEIIKNQTFSYLFKKNNPTPLQQALIDFPLTIQPQLFILEDVTGAGKTEAALMLAYRLMQQNSAKGIFIALPTMATSNAMYKRLGKVYRSFFKSQTASLILAHSKSRLMADFKQAIFASFEEEQALIKEEQPATSRCHAWFTDNRKKCLLADVGVGTLDQVLQAILPNKHQSLRLLGLFNKILIIDEVHACDSYMLKLLQTVLQFHAASGGSAILLSATLPTNSRYELAKSFAKGIKKPLAELDNKNYPLISHIYQDELEEYPVATRKEVARTVTIVMTDNCAQVEQTILQAINNQQAVCWIRNTITDAIDTYQKLAAKLTSNQLILFHARFTLADRLAIENNVLQTFGINSTLAERQGKCVIATQVIEQSLDIDFDFMVSDLAPIDALIQRAGRLQRHQRSYRDELQPTMLVYGPMPIADADAAWYAKSFSTAQAVYPNHAQLWLTAKLLNDTGKISMPTDARDLIAGVYDEDASDKIPTKLISHFNNAIGSQKARGSIAFWSALSLKNGYCKDDNSPWLEDKYTPSRLGEKTITLRLAKWQNEQLIAWNNIEEHAWYQSEVNVAVHKIANAADPTDPLLSKAIQTVNQMLPDKGKWSIVLPLEFDAKLACWIGHGLTADNQKVTVHYDSLLGLRILK